MFDSEWRYGGPASSLIGKLTVKKLNGSNNGANSPPNAIYSPANKMQGVLSRKERERESTEISRSAKCLPINAPKILWVLWNVCEVFARSWAPGFKFFDTKWIQPHIYVRCFMQPKIKSVFHKQAMVQKCFDIFNIEGTLIRYTPTLYWLCRMPIW